MARVFADVVDIDDCTRAKEEVFELLLTYVCAHSCLRPFLKHLSVAVPNLFHSNCHSFLTVGILHMVVPNLLANQLLYLLQAITHNSVQIHLQVVLPPACVPHASMNRQPIGDCSFLCSFYPHFSF